MQPHTFTQSLLISGRKKKGGKKHGNMMMLFGVVVLAMIKQMVLGKIAFLALAAFMLAKVSLLFSSLVNILFIGA